MTVAGHKAPPQSVAGSYGGRDFVRGPRDRIY